MNVSLRVVDSSGTVNDLDVSLDSGTSVTMLAAALADHLGVARASPATLIEIGARRVLPPGCPVDRSGLVSGATVSIIDANVEADASFGVIVRAVEGPDAGRSWTLRAGRHIVGRASDTSVRLDDPMASRRHALIEVRPDCIVVGDQESRNGVRVNGVPLTIGEATAVTGNSRIALGSSVLVADWFDEHGSDERRLCRIPFNRAPRLVPALEPVERQLPAAPGDPQRQPVPWLSALIPLGLGAVMFMATGSLLSILFFMMSPAMILGSVWEQRRFTRDEYDRTVAEFREDVQRQVARFETTQADERAWLDVRFPTTDTCRQFVATRGRGLWERDIDDPDALAVRAGRGRVRSASILADPGTGSRRFREVVEGIVDSHVDLEDAALAIPLLEVGSVGIAGRRPEAVATGSALIVQLVSTHPPGHLRVLAMVSADGVDDWRWLTWLPHHQPLRGTGNECAAFAVDDESVGLLRELGRVVAADEPPESLILLVIDDRVAVPRPALAALLDRLPDSRVAVIWVGDSTAAMPHALGSIIEISSPDHGVISWVGRGQTRVAALERIEPGESDVFARQLAPLVDVGQMPTADADLPATVPFTALVGVPAVLDEWPLTAAAWQQSAAPEERHRLGAPLGESVEGPFWIDLRADGPHALVAGTTGAGKSELLQTWVTSMASRHSPQRVTFLLVDYKGGAAFKDCVRLPHTVGLVTDLDVREVRRALVSLRAELTYREHVLASRGAKDLIDLEALHPDIAPPSLIIVVDEFAALAKEVPEFVDGMIDIAARGRSLGLHLVLATQRPAGVVTPAILANTGLRIALRTADESESTDVVGVKDAAHLDRARPGRALVRRGASEIDVIQAGYVGGVTSGVAPLKKITVRGRAPYVADESTHVVPVGTEDRADHERGRLSEVRTDLDRMVEVLGTAAVELGIHGPRKVWMEPLAAAYDLQSLVDAAGPCCPGVLPIALVDDPESQSQQPLSLDIGDAGVVMIYGAGGSGKTTALRSMAASIGMVNSHDPCWVYGLDFGGRALAAIEDLPYVGSVVAGTDKERVIRLLRSIRTTVSDREAEFARHHCDDFTQFREAVDPDIERIVVLLDNLGGFTAAFEKIDRGAWIDELAHLLSDGRRAGVNFVMTADRRAGVPSNMRGAVQRQLVLRLANDDEYLNLDVGSDEIAADAPSGRGLLGHRAIHIGSLAAGAEQGSHRDAVSELARRWCEADRWDPAPPIGALPESIPVDSLPERDDELVLAIAETDLSVVSLPRDSDRFAIFGPQRSGKTTALGTLAVQLAAHHDAVLWLTPGRMPAPVGEVLVRAHVEIVSDIDAVTSRVVQLLGSVGNDRIAGVSPSIAVLVDDLLSFEGTDAEGPLLELGAALGPLPHAVLAIASESRLAKSYSAFSDLIAVVTAVPRGVLLQPDPYQDATLFGIEDLPTAAAGMALPGRGFVVAGGRVQAAHVATPG